MIRYFYQMLDFLGSVFALLSPVTIIHWLIEATNEKALVGLVQWLDPFFHPLNSIFEPLFRSIFLSFTAIAINPFLAVLDNFASIYGKYDLIPTELPYEITIGTTGQIIPITQGLLGLAFTLLFFVCSFGAQMLRSLEQRLDVSKQDRLQRKRLQALQGEQKKKEHRVTINKNIMVYIACDFHSNANSAGYFEQLYARHNGLAREISPDSIGIEFSALDQALKYCIEASVAIIKYYASLRPADPQPPFRIGIHTHDKGNMPELTLMHCKALAHYAGENQSILSESVKTMRDALKNSQEYTLAPIGAYYLEGIGAQDLYRLVTPRS